jgi:hypothetical protein
MFNDKLLYVLDGVTFAGCTLWTDYGYDEACLRQYECIEYARNAMNDYRLIENGDRSFTPEDALELHKDHVAFLEQGWEADVIFTHHAPSFRSVNKKYKGDLMNGAYANHLDALVEKNKPKLWFHGHMHDPCEYMVGATKIICNPRGYVGERGIDGYKNDVIYEI